jgi:hypothetical protein
MTSGSDSVSCETRFRYRPETGVRWPHRFEIMADGRYSEIMAMCEPVRVWCAEQGMTTWIDVNGTCYFKDESEALAFRLHWT